MRKLLALVVASLIAPGAFATHANGQEILRTDVINVFFDPDTPLPAGQTFKSYYESKKFVYVYREIIPTEVGGNTYFAILGANSGYPDFYGGIQHFKDGSKAAIFSVWDVGADGACYTCLPGTAAPENQVSVWAKGARTVTRAFGGEGTGMNSMIYGFDWKLGQKVAMLASVEPAGRGSLISAAFKNGNEPWEFMASFYVPTRYDIGMPGNYSFLEDWTGGDENIPRSYLVGPTYLEDDNGKGTYLTNTYVGAHNPTGAKIANRHAITTEGSWLKVRSGIPVQPNAKAEYRLQLEKPIGFPDIRGVKAYIEGALEGKSTRNQERSVRLEIEAAAEDVRSIEEMALNLAIDATDAVASATKANDELSLIYQQSLSSSGNRTVDLNNLIDQIIKVYESETANLAQQTVRSVVFQNKATDLNVKVTSVSKQIDDSITFLNSIIDQLTKLKDVTLNATRDDAAIQELVEVSDRLSSEITLLKYSNSTSMSQLLSINSSINKHKNSILQLSRAVDMNLGTIEQAKKIISDSADKAASELKAKQEAAAKAAAKKKTITCVKGKLTKKVTAVKPECPKGYKKK